MIFHPIPEAIRCDRLTRKDILSATLVARAAYSEMLSLPRTRFVCVFSQEICLELFQQISCKPTQFLVYLIIVEP